VELGLLFQWLDDWGCNVSERIKAGDWVEFEGYRGLVFRVDDALLRIVHMNGTHDVMRCDAVTHLPDCTGWDWQPPPKYRPFINGWELVENAKGRAIRSRCGVVRLEVVHFDGDPLCAQLNGEWYSLDAICKEFSFIDTGEPCGVKEQ
jgi:hypothetical protein